MSTQNTSNTTATVHLRITYSKVTTAERALSFLQDGVKYHTENSLERLFHVLEISRFNDIIVVVGKNFLPTDNARFELMFRLHATLNFPDDSLEAVLDNPYSNDDWHYHFWIDKKGTFRFSGTADKDIDISLGANPKLESEKLRQAQIAAQKLCMSDAREIYMTASCYNCSAFNHDTNECDSDSAFGLIQRPDRVVCKAWWPDEHYIEDTVGESVYNPINEEEERRNENQ